MPKVMFEGQEFDIPESASIETLIERLGTGDANLIRHSLNGTEEVLPQGGHVHLNDGDRLSAISRFRTGKIVKIDCQEFEVCDDASTEHLLDRLDNLADSAKDRVHGAQGYLLYEVLPDGQQRVVCRGEAREVRNGQRFGTCARFIVC